MVFISFLICMVLLEDKYGNENQVCSFFIFSASLIFSKANGFIYDPSSPDFWSSSSNWKLALSIWGAIANRYSSRVGIGGYDLLNEP